MKLDEPQMLLEDAEDLLKEIDLLYKKSLLEKEIPKLLSLKIKKYLDNIRSALDYAAYYVFSNFCVQHISPKKIQAVERKVYFPIRSSKEKFDSYIKDVFVGLTDNQPEIVKLFKKHQPFILNPQWLKELNELSNANKHRNFSPQKRQQDSVVQLIGQNGGQVLMVNCQMDSIGLNGESYRLDPVTQLPTSNHNLKKAQSTIWVSFIFDDLKKPIMPTLNQIYSGASTIISDLEKVL